MQSIGQQMTAGLTLPLVGAGTLAVKTAGDYESLRVAMDTLNGSAEEGARNFERLKEFSAETPFQLQDLASAQNMLQGFSLSADEAFNAVSMIGDIAAVTGGDIQGIGVAFGQAAAEGRLMTRDIRQLINQGVPAISLLADTMDVAESEVLDLASEGKISFEILQQAFQDATEEGGIFANGMEKQANTIKGVFSTLRDNIDIALGEIGSSLVETFDIKGIMREMISSIQTGIQWFNNLSQETRQAAFTIAGLLGASGPIIAALGTLSLAIGAISAPIAGVVAAIAAGATAIVSNWDDVTSFFTEGQGARMWNTLQSIIDESVTAITAIWSQFGDDVVETADVSWGLAIDIIERSLDGILTIMEKFNGEFNTELNVFEDNILTTFQKIDGIIVNQFRSSMKTLLSILSEISSRAYTIFLEPWVDLLSTAENEAESSMGSVANIFNDSVDSFLNFIGVADAGPWTDVFGQIEQAATDAGNAVSDATGGGGGQAISVPVEFAPIEMPEDEIIPANLPSLEGLTQGIDFSVPDKIFPPGSLGALRERMTMLREQLSFATDPAIIARLKNEIGLTREQINQLTGNVNNTSSAMQQFGQIAGQALSQAVLHGNNLLDVLENLAKQLASRALIQGLTALITGGSSLAAGGIFSSIFGGIFHSGGIVGGSGERMILAQGGEGVFTPSQMRAMGTLINSRPQTTVTEGSLSKAFEMAMDRKLQKLSDNEIYALSQSGRRSY